ncbi:MULTISPECIES: GNAT family N-acetyltransferase [unclassified Nocardioides]|uniref:GNAT family N-acetyltransferase n=1 Tax=unclassified Nocardioides TaxID=2615069 RepID=UPI00301585BE
MIVRRARAADHAAAGAVTLAAYEPFLSGPDDDYAARLADAASRDAEAELWVAVAGEELLGCVTLCPPGSPWREIARDDEGEFRMLAVSPAAQGRGVGRALVEQVLDRFRADGAAAVAMSSLREMTTAHRLYERLGFSRLPERDWHPLPEIDLIAFRREL